MEKSNKLYDIRNVLNIKVAIYIRVSTSHQIDKDSLPLQRKDLINYCKYVLNTNDFVIFEDAGYSAKNTDRPDYQKMMSRIRVGEFTHLLVWKIDRISRNLRDFSEMYDELKHYNVTLISKNEQFDTSTAMGEAMLKIILVFAELERKLTAERVFAVMMSRAEKGLWNGATVPFGYEWDEETRFPKPYEPETKIVQYTYDLYEELRSTTKVAQKLNAENIPTKRNATWTARTVGAILSNPFYIGTYRYNTKTQKTRRWKDKKEWIVIENNHMAIIAKEQFDKIQDILKNNYKGDYNRQKENTETHILSGIIRCSTCGNKMIAGNDRTRSNGFTPSRYTCYIYRNAIKCNNYASDLNILSFLINYISNYITLSNKITSNHSYRDMKSILLRGPYFSDIQNINMEDIKKTYTLLLQSTKTDSYKLKNKKENKIESITDKEKIYTLEKEKLENALKRLDDLYLYSQDSMPQKDFIIKRKEISDSIEAINAKINNTKKEEKQYMNNNDFSFILKSSFFLLTKHINTKKNIDVRHLLENVDKSVIKDFLSTIISEISVDHKKIHHITLKNGLTHHFEYEEN